MLRFFAILIFALNALLPAGIRLTMPCAPCATSCCAEPVERCCGSECQSCSRDAQPTAAACCGACEAPVEHSCGTCECAGVVRCAVSLLTGDCQDCCCCAQVGERLNGALAEKSTDLKRLLGFDADDVGVEPFHAVFVPAVLRRDHAAPGGMNRPPDSRRQQARLCIWTI